MTSEERPGRIVLGRGVELSAPATNPGLARPAAAALLAAGLVFVAGSLADYVILWLINRQDGPQWEFAAVTTTVEGMSRIVLGVALVYAGLHLRARPSVWLRRALGAALLLIALAALVLAALMAMDFLALRNVVRPEAIATFRATTGKTLFLCAIYALVALPAAVVSLRSGRSRT
jgi:hypothetical protein